MKRWIVFICSLLLVCAVAGGQRSAYAEQMHIGVMSGPTGMGMAQLMSQGSDAYAFEIYAAPTDATADLASGTLDLLCLPTNTAASMANAKADYISVLAVNCLGTLYLLSDGETEITSVAALDGQTVCAGVPSSTTGPILENLLAKNGVSANIEWEADHDAVAARMLQGDVHLAILPEPKASAVMAKSEGWQIALNISAAWDEAFDTSLPMGCIVARNAFLQQEKAAVDQFLADYEASIAFIGDPANLDQSAAMIAEQGIVPAAGLAKRALEHLYGAIVYKDGQAMRQDLTAFYDAIGLAQPVDAFYYEK